ncbi:MAG TPA: serine/threonine protein phosphatase [Planctomycetota bacterium]|nr:serine/threonine protein phosphatase [Planctomycetota bacterium]
MEILRRDGSVLIALADGAGGSAGGAEAAELAVRTILESDAGPDPAAWVMCLAEVDRRLYEAGGGETTAVAVFISPDCVVGASVGDSGAWIVYPSRHENLTGRQQRKPLLGSGVAVPVLFEYREEGGVVLAATDGLLKYTSPEKICEVICRTERELAPGSLIDLVRLRSGSLQDDVAVALCDRGRTPTRDSPA